MLKEFIEPQPSVYIIYRDENNVSLYKNGKLCPADSEMMNKALYWYSANITPEMKKHLDQIQKEYNERT